MSTRLKLILASLGLLGVLAFASLMGGPLNRFFLLVPGIDKPLHFTFYIGLFLVMRALAATMIPSPRIATGLTAVVGLTIAIADELLQGIVATRTVELADLGANVSGLTLGYVISERPRRSLSLPVAAAAIILTTSVTYGTHVRMRDYARALRYERQHDFVRAREFYLRALQSGLRTAALFNGLGWVEVESGRGDPQKAVEYALAALDLRPGDPDILDTYGWALHHAGRSADALSVLEAAYARHPRMYSIHYHLGVVYRALGRRQDAVDHLRGQLAFKGTREAAFAQQILMEMGLQGEALK